MGRRRWALGEQRRWAGGAGWALAPALLALQLGAGDGQTPCVDPTTGKSLQELVTAEGSGLATPYGQMVINPCVPMTSAPNPACPASAMCCINLNSSSWTSCGSAPTWLRFGEFEARAQTGQRITGGGICAQIPLKFFETTITFECDEGAVGAGRVVPQAMPPGFVWDTCMMNVTWYTRLVCGEAVNPPAPSPGAPGEAAGWGWPFLLVIGLGSGLYCGAGAFYNSRKYMLPVRLPPLFSSAPLVSTLLPQFPCRSPADPAAVAAQFPDNLPQHEFWKEVPSLCSDGVAFTQSKLPEKLGGGAADKYQPTASREETEAFDAF